MVDPAWLARVRQKNREAVGLAGMGQGSASRVLARYQGATALDQARARRERELGVPILTRPPPSRTPRLLFAAAGVVALLGIGAMLFGGRR